MVDLCLDFCFMLVHYDEAFKESIIVLPIMDVNPALVDEYEILKEVGEGGFFGCLLMA
jgi:hypothetical protein